MNANNLTHRFHFSLGPVQGFVSQARRTRDFWSGSFILSWLTANAMKAVRDQGGEITLPDVKNDELLKWVENSANKSSVPPTIGTIPNRFTAIVPKELKGDLVAKTVQGEWKKLADAVWNKDLNGIADGSITLWNNQIDNFWEISWVLVPEDQNNTNLLDRRKNRRSHYPPEQFGDKCTMMGEWQELSGVERPNRAEQEKFWNAVRSRIDQKLDLQEGERLCAIAYVKRRFVYVWQEELYKDWKLAPNVPSVSYMAAVRWLEELIKAGPDKDLVKKMCDVAENASALGERATRIKCVSDALSANHVLTKEIADIDGRLFFGSELRPLANAKKKKKGEISAKEAEDISAARNKMLESVLNKEPDFPKEPTPFYAILLMDGDRLGEAIASGGADNVTRALEAFTRNVSPIVSENNGFLIYAGGDDVLALLPLEDAMKCAVSLRKAYCDAFKANKFECSEEPAVKRAGISAAIIYAHMKMPLTAVLKDSHRLLDDIAKEKTGRNAVAVRVWKPGGIQNTWAMKWGDAGETVDSLENLVKEFQKTEADKPGHASKPLYRIRERLEMLNGESIFSDDELIKLLVAEYVTTGVLSKEETKDKIAEDRVKRLLSLCKKPDKTYGAEAAMLVRFLAQKGVEL